jgi:hypothetical protein
MTTEDLSQESDVATESGEPTAEVPESSAQDQSGQTQEAIVENKEEKLSFNDPKHPDHARFRELHEQATQSKAELARERQEREQLLNQYKQMEAYIQQIQAQNQKKAEPSYQPLIQHLEQINPEFAHWQAKALQAAESLPQLKQELEEMKNERFKTEALSTLGNLYTEHKISDELKPYYQEAIENLVYKTEAAGKKLGLKDIPKLFKDVHDRQTKFFEDFRRKERASYVSDKKKDAAPATTTGGSSAKGSTNKDPQITRDQLKAELVAALRKGKQTI